MTDDLDTRLDEWRMRFQSQLAEWHYNRQNFLSMNQTAADFGLLVVKSLILVNGAAVVAILAFAAQLWSPEKAPEVATKMLAANGEFVIGLAAGLICAGLRITVTVTETCKRARSNSYKGSWRPLGKGTLVFKTFIPRSGFRVSCALHASSMSGIP